MIDSLAQIINSVPDLLWGAIIASSSTLLGIFISNRGAQKRLENQFTHESKQKKIEREQTLKREIFLDTIEKLETVYLFIGKIPYATPEQITNFSIPSIGKISAIANEKTITATNDLSFFLGQKVLLLLPKKLPISELEGRAENTSKTIKDILEQQKIIINKMNTFNLEGSQDFPFFDRLQAHFKDTQEQFSRLDAQQEQEQQQLRKLQVTLALEIYEILTEGIKYYSNFIKCLRDELDLPINVETYKSEMHKRMDHMKVELRKFIQEIELQLENDNRDASSKEKQRA